MKRNYKCSDCKYWEYHQEGIITGEKIGKCKNRDSLFSGALINEKSRACKGGFTK